MFFPNPPCQLSLLGGTGDPRENLRLSGQSVNRRFSRGERHLLKPPVAD